MKKIYRFCFLLLFIALSLSGCAYYSFTGSLPGHIRTAAVPLFRNETVEPGLIDDLTDEVQKAILSNGQLKLAGEFQADAVVYGTVVNVRDEEYAIKGGQAAQFRIVIVADVLFTDRIKNRPLIEEKGVQGWGIYDAQGAAGATVSRDEAKQQAVKMLAAEIIDKTLTGW